MKDKKNFFSRCFFPPIIADNSSGSLNSGPDSICFPKNPIRWDFSPTNWDLFPTCWDFSNV